MNPEETAFETRAHPRWPGARSSDRRAHHADLPDVHLRPGGGRREQGLRLRARGESDPHGAAESALASLENAAHGVAFSSGLGATTTLMHLVNPGDRVVLIADVYGGVYRMTSQVYEPRSVFEYLPAPGSPNPRRPPRRAHASGLGRKPVQSDAERRGHHVHRERGYAAARSSSSTTFATPYLQSPLDLAAEHRPALGKYLGGHSDVIGGFVATNDPTIAERLYFLQKSLGAVPAPSTRGSSCAG